MARIRLQQSGLRQQRGRHTTTNDISSENKDVTVNKVRKPLKKAHSISNRIIVVIDDTLVKRLAIDENETWFEQSEYDNGIFLRIRRMNNTVDR